ncbi:MAG TPA: sigma-70 family RNA polymerase sigma factor [Verrucomicrobiota bacterium]|nr:hypothetical protein [Verrucomicrobiales bacterium]HRI16071.1 sigma-70 family RNA polymerase sigma factor [Verrucomicrobiota bacterium]
MGTATNASRRTSVTLINRIKDLDDEDGWKQFFERYRRLVMSIGRQHGLTESEAEEVGQEVFSRVARNIGVFETGGRPGAFRRWLGQLTTWCAIDAQRKRRLVVSPLPREGSDDRASAAETVPAPGSDDPVGEVTDRDFHELLLRRLKQLVSAKDFQIYQLITFEGWTPVQVADHLKMRRGTVDTIICRTRQTARRELERLGERIG